MRRLLWMPCLLVLLAGSGWSQSKPSVLQKVSFAGVSFAVVTADLSKTTLELHWKNPLGQPYRSLSALEGLLIAQGKRPLALMNAGIFDTSNRPLGLQVERGKVLRPLSTRSQGYGNFYLQPNGVFWLEQGVFGQVRARLAPTGIFARAKPKALEATQSGPMLVVNGKVNSLFRRNSTNQIVRNAIGVCGPSRVLLVLALEPSNFDTLARLFLEKLKCPNALYLDGNVSALRVADSDVQGDGDFGGMIALLEK